jgi:hypothetical protein
MKIRLNPPGPSCGETLRTVIALEERPIEEFGVFGKVVDAGNELEPRTRDRHVVDAGPAGTFRHCANTVCEALERRIGRIPLGQPPGNTDVITVSKGAAINSASLESRNEVVSPFHTI